MKVHTKFLRLRLHRRLARSLDRLLFVVMVGSEENAVAENQESLNIHVPVYPEPDTHRCAIIRNGGEPSG